MGRTRHNDAPGARCSDGPARTSNRPLFSERRGTGRPAVVFLHGLAGSGRYWYRVAERLRESGGWLELVDLLGFGRSPWPDIGYTMDDHLAALTDWRAAAGLAEEPLTLVGHSLGALLALEWAARAPLVRGVVLVGLPVYRDPARARRRLARLSLLHRLTLTARPLAWATCLVMCQFRPLWRLLVPLIIPQVPPEVARDGVLHTWRSLSGTLEGCIFGTTFDQVCRHATALPILFVHGDADDTAPCETVRALVADLPRARLVDVPGGGHDLPLTHPDRIATEISIFMAAPGEPAATRSGDGLKT